MADIFEAIADPSRRKIMDLLLTAQVSGNELTVSELVQQTGLGQPTVSKHLKTLREAGLVSAREDGQKRFYSITPEPLEEIEDWMIDFLSLGFDAEAEDDFARNLGDAGEKLGHWITEKAGWLSTQLQARLDEADLNVDPKDLGKRLGRKLAEVKVDAEKNAKDFEKIARQKMEEVVDEVKTESAHFAEEVKRKVKRS
jgi:DNA-binding transcriptional ArsR family regulator